MAFKEIKEVILSGLDSKAHSLVREYDRNLSFGEIKKLWRLSTQRIDSPFVAEYIMNNSSHSWKLDPIDKRPSGVNSFTLACELNLQGVVKLLLTDNRIDPTIGDGQCIRVASQRGCTEIVKLLLEDGRINPSNWTNWSIIQACEQGFTKIVKLLLVDERVDPSDCQNEAIIKASINGHTDIVGLLLIDGRSDPSENNNYAILDALGNDYIDIVKLLLENERVKQSLTNDEKKYILKKLKKDE